MTRWSVRSFPCSDLLASLARSAALTRSLALLTHSLPGSWDIGIFLSHFLSVLNHCDQQNPFISHPPNHFSQSKNFMSYSSIVFCFHIPRVASASAYAFASAFASLAYFSPPSQAEFDFFPPPRGLFAAFTFNFTGRSRFRFRFRFSLIFRLRVRGLFSAFHA